MREVRFLVFCCLLPTVAAAATNAPAFRDPFWPIGYRPATEETPPRHTPQPVAETPAPPPPEPPKPVADWEAARKLLKVRAYAEKDGRKGCLVNDKFVEEGGLVSVVYQSMLYTWRVRNISRDFAGIVFEEVSFGEPPPPSQK